MIVIMYGLMFATKLRLFQKLLQRHWLKVRFDTYRDLIHLFKRPFFSCLLTLDFPSSFFRMRMYKVVPGDFESLALTQLEIFNNEG